MIGSFVETKVTKANMLKKEDTVKNIYSTKRQLIQMMLGFNTFFKGSFLDTRYFKTKSSWCSCHPTFAKVFKCSAAQDCKTTVTAMTKSVEFTTLTLQNGI